MTWFQVPRSYIVCIFSRGPISVNLTGPSSGSGSMLFSSEVVFHLILTTLNPPMKPSNLLHL